MKKFFVALAMLATLLTSTVAMAAFEETIIEDAELSAVKKLAIALPDFYKVVDREPSLTELTKMLADAGKAHSALEIVTYDDVASAIRRDTGINIYSLDIPEADKIFKENVAKYADAYLVVTIANNSDKAWLFYYIYDAADTKLMYAYQVQGHLIGRTTKDYTNATRDFFKQFDSAAAKSLNKEERKKFKEQQKESRENKREATLQIERKSKQKEDLVRKK